MPELILVMLLLPIIGCFFVLTAPDNKNNAYNVVLFTLSANILTVLRLFSFAGENKTEEIAGFSFNWLENIGFELYFGVDAFALLLILAFYMALIRHGRIESDAPQK